MLLYQVTDGGLMVLNPDGTGYDWWRIETDLERKIKRLCLRTCVLSTNLCIWLWFSFDAVL